MLEKYFTKDERNSLLFLVVFLIIGLIIINVKNVSSFLDADSTSAVQDSIKKVIEISHTPLKIHLNTADLETIAELPGIGPAKAEAIYSYRQENGKFGSLIELVNIKGIGTKTLAKLLPHLVMIGDSTEVYAFAGKDTKAEDAALTVTNSEVINLNTASLQLLQTLPSIGAKKAQAIIDYRIEHGDFHSIEDIIKVKGIGEGIFAKIKDKIEV